jgi:glyoxylase-like metal-dependent hydrolase (beta-lactamase superfamily II)
MSVIQVAPGLWRWTAPHPEWSEGADWPRDVGCVYYEAPDAIVLIDPLVPEERERFFEALDADVARLGLPVAIVLTVSWHDRSATELAERYGARIGPPPGGVVEFPVPGADETAYWIPQHLALVVGDTLLGHEDEGLSLCPESWLDGNSREAVRNSLRVLLELPIEHVLTSHGEPVLQDGRAALERALRA